MAHLRADWLRGIFGVLGVVTVLELFTRSGAIGSRQLPPPSTIFRTLATRLDSIDLWSDVLSTLQGWGAGLLLALAVAVPIGVAIGSSSVLYRSLRVVIDFLRPVPSVALIPLVILVFGAGLESKVFLVSFASFWPVLIQTIYGVQDADPVAVDTARAFRLRWAARFARVTLPGASPHMATGLRIASTIALVIAITAELVIGTEGLGRSIAIAQESGAVELMYALVMVTGILAWAINSSFIRVERRVLHWHARDRHPDHPT